MDGLLGDSPRKSMPAMLARVADGHAALTAAPSIADAQTPLAIDLASPGRPLREIDGEAPRF